MGGVCPRTPKSNIWGRLGADVAHTGVCVCAGSQTRRGCLPAWGGEQEGMAFLVSLKGRQTREVQGIDGRLLGHVAG